MRRQRSGVTLPASDQHSCRAAIFQGAAEGYLRAKLRPFGTPLHPAFIPVCPYQSGDEDEREDVGEGRGRGRDGEGLMNTE